MLKLPTHSGFHDLFLKYPIVKCDIYLFINFFKVIYIFFIGTNGIDYDYMYIYFYNLNK